MATVDTIKNSNNERVLAAESLLLAYGCRQGKTPSLSKLTEEAKEYLKSYRAKVDKDKTVPTFLSNPIRLRAELINSWPMEVQTGELLFGRDPRHYLAIGIHCSGNIHSGMTPPEHYGMIIVVISTLLGIDGTIDSFSELYNSGKPIVITEENLKNAKNYYEILKKM